MTRVSLAEGNHLPLFPVVRDRSEGASAEMLEACQSSRIVPYGADQTLFVVVDRVAPSREVRSERTDLEATIRDLVAGCFNDPVQVMSFNTLEHWVKDVSTEIAAEIQSRCDIDGAGLPDHLRDFIESHICPAARRVAALDGSSPTRRPASR